MEYIQKNNIERKKEDGIKSGTLRRAYYKALDEHIVCRNQIIITLAAMETRVYAEEDKLKLARILKDNGYDGVYIRKVINQVTIDYFPTTEQTDKLLDVVSGEYQYQEGYIKDLLMKCIKEEDLKQNEVVPAAPKAKNLSGKEIKNYIYMNNKIETVLEEIGCHHINLSKNGKEYRCANYDGDRPDAVRIKINPYLGVTNFTRQNEFEDKTDIIDLVKYNKKCDFKTAMKFLRALLGLTDEKIADIDFTVEYDYEEEEEKEPEPLHFYSEKVLEKDYYYPAMDISFYEEGITEEARKRFGVLLSCCKEKEWRGTVIPLRHYETGKILGTNLRRNLSDIEMELYGVSGKYHVTKGYPKSRNVYGLWENREIIKEAGQAIIFEGEKSPMKLFSRGDGTGVSIQGSNLYDEQIKILTDLEVDLIVSMDADVPLDEVRFMCDKLYEKSKKKVYYTIDNHGFMGEKDSIADLPKEQYDIIFSEKVLFDERERELYLESMKKR